MIPPLSALLLLHSPPHSHIPDKYCYLSVLCKQRILQIPLPPNTVLRTVTSEGLPSA